MPSLAVPMPSSDDATLQQQLSASGMQITIAPLPGGGPAAPGPDAIITGHVSVPEVALRGVDRLVLQHRGIEVVGGTLDDYDDRGPDTLAPKKGVRALNRVYFDERLVLWQRGEDGAAAATAAAGNNGVALLPFSIAYPNANYPSQVRSVSKAAPSQSFEIAYHIVAWLAAADNELVARAAIDVPFVPVYSIKPHLAPPPPPASQTGFDDRGKECLLTRVTLSQSDYTPGEQVVAGVYIECTKANRSIRKAECTLRQRVECRMRRTFSPAETAEIASSSRPQSSQPSAASDDSDVLWSRVIDVGPTQPLTLTTSGVGLAAAAAGSAHGTQQQQPGSGSPLVSDASSELPDKRDSAISRPATSRGSGIIAGFRSCMANMHTSIPTTAAMVSGHYLLFSYELQIDVTLGSIARGSQKIATRTQLGGSTGGGGAATPTSASGFTLSRLSVRHRALAEAHASSGSVSATAACFPQSAIQTPASFVDAREAGDLRQSRFSFAGDGPGSEGCDARRFSSLVSAPIRRDFSRTSAAESQTAEFAELPNAVEQLRYRCAASLALMPKIFDPSRPAAADSASAVPDMAGASAITPAPSDTPSPNGAPGSAPTSPGPGKVFIGTAQAPVSAGADASRPGQLESPGASKPVSASSSSGEDDLARAVAAAAEKVMNDKTWEQPDSCFLLPVKKRDKRKAKGARAEPRARSGSSSGDSQPMFDAEEGDSDGSGSKRSSESSHYSRMDRSEIEDAINRLAPIKQQAGLQVETSGLDDMMQGMGFFDARDTGPELTGLLSADPDKLTFGDVPLLNGALVAAAASEEDTATADEAPAALPLPAEAEPSGRERARSRLSTRFGWKMLTPPPQAPQQIASVLRRSISMPSGTTDGRGSADLREAAEAEAMAQSPQPTVAQSTHGSGEYKSVLIRKSRLSGVSPSSMLSAMSSTSRLGAASRANMLRTIGSRMSSWFSKK